jgi:hypothetical protein
VTESETRLSNRALTTPRAAAIAGILFAVLLSTSLILIQLSIPADLLQTGNWLEENARAITLAISLVPFAGIAFLWFMGVVRNRMGRQEDQFFSTLFFGSGYLYLGMTFAAAAVAGGDLVLYALDPDLLVGSEVHALALIISNRLNTMYAMRMAGMFMIVLGTIWIRTQVMPRWLALVTYVLAVVLLISIGFTIWVILLFPAWVFLISVSILVMNYRVQRGDVEQPDGLTMDG